MGNTHSENNNNLVREYFFKFSSSLTIIKTVFFPTSLSSIILKNSFTSSFSFPIENAEMVIEILADLRDSKNNERISPLISSHSIPEDAIFSTIPRLELTAWYPELSSYQDICFDNCR